MRITFILNQIGQCGGVSNVLHIAKELVKRKHEVSVRYPAYSLKKYARSVIDRNKVGWMDTEGIDVKCVPSLEERYIPDGDAVVATWWETAYDVEKYSDKKGEKWYYVQHNESLWQPFDKVVDTYWLDNMRIITNSRWTKGQIENLGAVVEGIVYPGISDCFFPLFYENSNTIGVAYREQLWKGWGHILLAYMAIQLKNPDAMLALFGHRPPWYSGAPFRYYFYQSPSDEVLNWLYNNFSVFVSASYFEGFSMTPLEAMRCKIPVCTTKVGVFNDFEKTGAFTSKPREPTALAKNILFVLENDVSKNVERAYKFASQFTFEKSARAMEGALLS